MRVEELENYSEERARYEGALMAAKAAGDEVAELKAELEWRNTLDKLREEASRREQYQRSIEQAKEQARQTYGLAPAAVYEGLTDPQKILEAAKQAHEAIEQARGAVPEQQQEAPAAEPQRAAGLAARWTSAPGSGEPVPPPPPHPLDSDARLNQLLQEARTKTGESGLGFNDPRQVALRDYFLEQVWYGPRPRQP